MGLVGGENGILLRCDMCGHGGVLFPKEYKCICQYCGWVIYK